MCNPPGSPSHASAARWKRRKHLRRLHEMAQWSAGVRMPRLKHNQLTTRLREEVSDFGNGAQHVKLHPDLVTNVSLVRLVVARVLENRKNTLDGHDNFCARHN